MPRILKIILSLCLMAALISCAGMEKKAGTTDDQQKQPADSFKLPDAEQTAKPADTAQTAVAQQKTFLQPVLPETGADGEKYILLNFENTDVQTIISTFGELLNINYILTPGVSGSITIQSYKKVAVKDLFQIFQSILELNGLTAVKEGDFYKIVPIDSAKLQPLEIEKGKQVEYKLDPTFVTQLIQLQHVKVGDVVNILRGLTPRGTDIIVYEPSNLLIVTALPSTLSKFVKIIEALDVSDTEVEAVKTFVYYVENGEAKKLEDILNRIYVKSSDTRPTAPSASAAAAQPGAQKKPAAPATTAPAGASAIALPADIGELSITSYEDINALIIKCTPRAYLSLLDVLKKIDIPPRQVLIEVMVAEIALTDKFQFGLEWLVKSSTGNVYGLNLGSVATPTAASSFPSNSFAAVLGGKSGSSNYNAVFSSLTTFTDVNVLASPVVLATDNKDAEIKIGSEVPTATSSTTSSEGVTTTAQIQYKTVGTLLTVTPHITEKGNVSMKVVIESSDVLGSTAVGSTGNTYPTFSTRRATTTAVIEDGHTLFIGGLIYDKKSKGRSGIPFLSRIPLIGYLFGYSTDEKSKSELIIMVTPRVINNKDEADAASAEFIGKVKFIKENLKLVQKEDKDDASTTEKQQKTEPIKN